MALSDYERQMLEELEAQLADEDPSFAATMKPAPVRLAPRQLSLRNLVIGLVVAAAGIGVLVAGISMDVIVLGIAGVAIMFVGFWYVGAGFGEVSAAARADSESEGQPQARERQAFMDRQADRWNRRHED